jgi:hypothetical protein
VSDSEEVEISDDDDDTVTDPPPAEPIAKKEPAIKTETNVSAGGKRRHAMITGIQDMQEKHLEHQRHLSSEKHAEKRARLSLKLKGEQAAHEHQAQLNSKAHADQLESLFGNFQSEK